MHPLLATAVSPYYAGIFDDDTDFSASLVKVAALFAAGRMLTAAKIAVTNATSVPNFFSTFNAALKTEIDTFAHAKIRAKVFPSGSPVGLYPSRQILLPTGVGTAAATVKFTSVFNENLNEIIVNSADDPQAPAVIDRLGYGYISAALVEAGFFDPTSGTGVGIWLAADYGNSTVVRIPCLNDHPDAQLATTRQICRMFALLRLNLLPDIDTETNTLMEGMLKEPKDHQTIPWLAPGHHGTTPWLDPSRLHIGRQFSVVLDKIGFAGLGSSQSPNVYSEGLVIKWADASQVDAFNSAHPSTHLTGEIAVGWQNLLAEDLRRRTSTASPR